MKEGIDVAGPPMKENDPTNIQTICLTAAIFDGDRLLVVKRSEKDDLFPNKWEMVGGGLDMGESYERGLRREIHEEAGIDAEVIVPYYCFDRSETREGVVNHVLEVCFICRTDNREVSLSDEHSDFRFIEENDIETFFSRDEPLYKAVSLAFKMNKVLEAMQR